VSLNLVTRYVKDRWVSVTVFSFSLFLYCWLIVSIMPTFIGNVEFMKLIEQYPRELLVFFAPGSDVASIFTPEGFLALEFLSLWWVFIVAGFAIPGATAIVAKEVDEGTVDFLLAQPLKRATLILNRFLALLLCLFVLAAVPILSIYFLGIAYDVELGLGGLIATGVMGFVFFVSIASYSLLLSLLLRERSEANIASVSLLLVVYLLNALSELSDSIEKFRFLSFFRYFRPDRTLANGEIPLRDLSVFLAIIAVCLVFSFMIFRRKDIRAV
jgi:ABC-2 type transport system permease protein